MPATPPANPTPMGICSIDPTTGLVYSNGCANYYVITTAGTATLGGNDPAGTGGGIFYGATCVATGTTWTLTPYDIIVRGTTTTTVQMNGTITAAATGFQGNPGPGGNGVQFLGSLIIITTGTPGQWNVLWD